MQKITNLKYTFSTFLARLLHRHPGDETTARYPFGRLDNNKMQHASTNWQINSDYYAIWKWQTQSHKKQKAYFWNGQNTSQAHPQNSNTLWSNYKYNGTPNWNTSQNQPHGKNLHGKNNLYLHWSTGQSYSRNRPGLHTSSTLLKIHESTQYISSLAMVHYIFMNPYGTQRFKLIRQRLRTTIRTPNPPLNPMTDPLNPYTWNPKPKI